MTRKKSADKSFFLRWLFILAAIFFILAAGLTAAYLYYEKKYTDRIFPGVYVGAHDLSGLTREAAKERLNGKIDLIYKKGIVFTHDSYRASLFPLIASVEGDLAYRIFDFDVEKNVNEAFAFGRGGNFTENAEKRLGAFLFPYYRPAYHVLNETEAEKFLTDNFSKYLEPAKDATLTHSGDRTLAAIKFAVQPEKTGRAIDYGASLAGLRKNLADLNDESVPVLTDRQLPRILLSDCLNIETKAKKILAAAPLSLAYGSDVWLVTFDKLVDWLALKPGPDSGRGGDAVIVGIDRERAGKFLTDWVAPDIDREPANAKFEIKNGRVIEFQVSRDGLSLDIDGTITGLEASLLASSSPEIGLIVKETKSALRTENINDLGIKEIIGIGASNFSGSPKNRRHNIGVGANTLNGLLIKPGEEFSLIGALGDIDKEAGYLPELVIKDNKTTPEYGGGLCQIGTTMFRATIASGLPVTMRRNHSYRVSYYEPAGTDATIYNPWPDYKFINDTGYHILIQTRIEGDSLYFDFWGTRDGRRAEKTEPTIYNIIKPAPTKFIETLDLKPGVKKCTEHAHNGADTYFDYKVSYPDGTVKENRFKSHYVPWREVCLLGVEKLSADMAATSSVTDILP